jgi:hypothetical protein
VTDERSGDVADATLHEFASGQKLFGRYHFPSSMCVRNKRLLACG